MIKKNAVLFLVLSVLLSIIMAQPAHAVALPSEEIQELVQILSSENEGYNIVVVDLPQNARASTTATIPANSIAIISEPYQMNANQTLSLSFTMTRRTEDISVAVARSNQTVSSIVYSQPEITKSGFFNVVYTYESSFLVSSNGAYYLIVRNAEQNSVSISDIVITKS